MVLRMPLANEKYDAHLDWLVPVPSDQTDNSNKSGRKARYRNRNFSYLLLGKIPIPSLRLNPEYSLMVKLTNEMGTVMRNRLTLKGGN